ncbi:hypothetical protein JB92DRAFT_2829008 [Gautieria morchelliformis]|nr:hypothetical protein JB92DRAFT_2829008 [Gautieria morchelliformis]
MFLSVGSFALLGSVVPRDAGVAARLRASGAIILAKPPLSEWAHFHGGLPNGFSGCGSQALNPYFPQGDPGQVPAVESSRHRKGTVADAYIARILEVNHQVASLRAVIETNPNSLQQVSALDIERRLKGKRRSFTLLGSVVPRDAGITAKIHASGEGMGVQWQLELQPVKRRFLSFDTSLAFTGPLGTETADAATSLSVIAGLDPFDNFILYQSEHVPDFTQASQKDTLKGVCLGTSRLFFGNGMNIISAFNASFGNIEAVGHNYCGPG